MKLSKYKPFRISIAIHVVLLSAAGLSVLLSGCLDKKKTVQVFELVAFAPAMPVKQANSPKRVAPAPEPLPKLHKPEIKPIPKKAPEPVKPKPKPVEKKAPPKKAEIIPKETAPIPKKVSMKDFIQKHGKPEVKKTPVQTPKSPQVTVKRPDIDVSKFKDSLSESIASVKLSAADAQRVSQAEMDALQKYVSLLYAQIDRMWQRPNIKGEAYVDVRVNSAGGLQATLVRSSGDAAFDRSIMDAIRAVGSFAPPPGGVPRLFGLSFNVEENYQ